MKGHYDPALYLFVGAGLTDLVVRLVCQSILYAQVDGYIAKHMNQKSVFGSFIDPLADKALLTFSAVSMAIKGVLPRMFSERRFCVFNVCSVGCWLDGTAGCLPCYGSCGLSISVVAKGGAPVFLHRFVPFVSLLCSLIINFITACVLCARVDCLLSGYVETVSGRSRTANNGNQAFHYQ